MFTGGRVAPVSVARMYFALQAVGGAAWWVAVFASDDVRISTLGRWDPSIVVGPDLVLFVGTSALAALVASRIAAATAVVWTTAVTVALGFYGLVVFWTTFFVVVPLVLATVEERLHLRWDVLGREGLRVSGAAAFVLGSALGLWACVTMALRGNGTPLPAETARELVIAGPYRFVRNPMALAGMVQTAGVGLVVRSWMVITIAVAGALTWNVLIRPTEEADLAARFGAPYRRYTDQVRCWVPRRPLRQGQVLG